MLNELNTFVKEMDVHGGVQIIVLEHIEETHWVDLDWSDFILLIASCARTMD
ncbi:hypothetical protein [Paraburkholderia sp. GV072]|uniref:hypothetical protein n=1 Tax=Paraburkholderia sp. GV072 TaxID=2135698 RepID=UPI0021592C4D|nr:hypothetical protein [Paraburkholderia sp. GV072]